MEQKKRQSNFELLRILLIFVIVAYHLMLYTGCFFVGLSKNMVIGFFLSSGGAITADYAFIALTSYFLLETRDCPVIRRFLSFGAQVLTLYVIRFVVIRSLWGLNTGNWFVEDFIMKGAWWFVTSYMILLLIYPVLNIIIEKMPRAIHGFVCLVLGFWFLWNGYTLQINTINDLLAFVFTYMVMGYLRRSNYRRWILPTKKRWMALIYIAGFLFTFLFGLYVKIPGVVANEDVANELIQHLIGKYAPIQFVMGIAVFFFFRSLPVKQSDKINQFAKNVFFIFLLHEMVMGVYWYFGRLDGMYPYYSTKGFLGWLLIYEASCLVVGVLVQKLYSRFLAPLWGTVIDWICKKCSFR